MKLNLDNVKLQFEWYCLLGGTVFAGENLVQHWDVTARLTSDAFDDEDPVGRWSLMVLPLTEMTDPAAYLRSLNGDVARFAEMFRLDTRTTISESPRVILVHVAEIDERYRGHGTGAVLTAMVVERLMAGVSHVVLHPDPLQTITDPDDLVRVRHKIERVWQSVGAEPASSGLWVVPLTSEVITKVYRLYRDYERDTPRDRYGMTRQKAAQIRQLFDDIRLDLAAVAAWQSEGGQ